MNICFVFVDIGYFEFSYGGIESQEAQASYRKFIIPEDKIGQPDLDILLSINQSIPDVSEKTHSVVERLLNRLGHLYTIPECARDLIEYYDYWGEVGKLVVFSNLDVTKNNYPQTLSPSGTFMRILYSGGQGE